MLAIFEVKAKIAEIKVRQRFNFQDLHMHSSNEAEIKRRTG